MTNTPLTSPEFGSYPAEDVVWLLKDLSNAELEAPGEEREEAIQAGASHYAESLPIEYKPSEEYQVLFHEALAETKTKLAEAIAFVSEQIYTLRNNAPVLVSLARAGVPVGVLVKRYLKLAYNYDAPHYAVSIVRGKGIDYNAMKYIAAHHPSENVMFVDGWTGKGAITQELKAAVAELAQTTGIVMNPELAVLADPGNSVTVYGTREDYLIPSACLNSTVSGLVSRTVLNEAYIGPDNFHGAKFYKEMAEGDVSNLFIETVAAEFLNIDLTIIQEAAKNHVPEAPDWSGWAKTEEVSREYGINSVNLVKPGVGETTRVLLRRVPWAIIIRPSKKAHLKHILLLAEQRNVRLIEDETIPYACIGLIHPQYTKGAVGFDGKTLND